jgi:hypothetical protein
MALICCPECGKEISDASAQCIHCGYPIGRKNVQKRVLVLLALVVALVLAAALYCGTRFSAGGMGLSLPYGLETGMSPRQLHEQMQVRGFVPDFEEAEGDRLEFIYEAREVYGHESYMTVLSTAAGAVDVAHLYREDALYGTKKLSPLYISLREMLVEEYGLPTHEAMGECAWEEGAFAVRLYYVGESGGSLWLDTAYQP